MALDYEMWGNAGEPVVLVPAGIFADRFKPLRDEPALTGRHRVLSYHRVGDAGSSRVVVQHPRTVAEALAAFFARHPLRAP